MSNDLISRLLEAEEDLARTSPAADDALAGHVRAATGRRRRARRLREVAGGLAAAAVLGVSAWAVTTALPAPTPPVTTPTTPAPTVTTDPTPTPSPDPVPEPEPEVAPEPEAEPEVTGPPVRQETIDDATVLARLREPRTGEVWTTPERAPELDAVLSHEYAPMHAWRVGHRGEAAIVVLVDGAEAAAGRYDPLNGAGVERLFEVDTSGVRAIACPSARSTDACVDPTIITADVPLDEETFYDTMTLPTQVDLGDGWLLTTTATTRPEWFGQALLGDGEVLYDLAGRLETVADLGGMQVVEIIREGEVPGLDDRQYALRLPIGSTLALSANDSPSGQFANIRWDDGITRDLPDGLYWQSTAPGRGACFSGTFSVEAEHVDADWRAAGTTPGGHRVYVPAPGNATATAVRSWHLENSWTVLDDGERFEDATGLDAGYPHASDEAFLADHALYAIQGPDGQWQVRLRTDAKQVVYECA